MSKELAIYVHIPFCVRKCNYCDFLSLYAKKELMDSYFRALEKEIELRSKMYGMDSGKFDAKSEDGNEYVVRSIFFGGGTPSFADAADVCAILREIRRRFVVSEDAEISIEVNPASAMRDKLFSYKVAGFNRISIGCQTLNDDELKVLGRAHTSDMFFETYENARSAGFENINVDVMSALPGQSLESYMSTLRKVVELRPEHISAYSLIIEEGTPFYDMDLNLPGEDLDREMYHETKRFLAENGYHRYEISNYAISGKKCDIQEASERQNIGVEETEIGTDYECRHNRVYWRRGNYLGLGIGAASMVENVRWSNIRDIKKYIDVLNARDCEEGNVSHTIHKNLNDISADERYEFITRITEDKQELSTESQMEEFMFLGLRLVQGVSVQEFKRELGREISEVYGEVIDKYLDLGLLEYSGDNLRLTDNGLDVSNTVMAEFLL